MNEENESIRQIEQFKLRIKEKGNINQSLLEYLGISVGDINHRTKKETKSNEIYQILKNHNILTNKCEFKEFLETISHLWKRHHIKKEIKYKIEKLFQILKKDINQIFLEKEIFSFFRSCKDNFFLQTLVEHNIISVKTIIQNSNLTKYGDWGFIRYFYPEIRIYDDYNFNKLIKIEKTFKEFVEKNDQNLEYFNKIRKDGEKEPKIVELIKKDKIEEFISLVEHSPTDLNKEILIEDTIFETNTKKLTPIEYSALFGAITIFKYLYMKDVDLIIIADYNNKTIIEYAVQGRNYEIIHLLEERKEIIEELNNQEHQQKYLKNAIKMHHNEIFEYFMTNYICDVTEKTIYFLIISRNSELFSQLIEINQIDFKDKSIISIIFNAFCKNGNEEIVKILINQPNLDINAIYLIIHYLKNNRIRKRIFMVIN